MICPEMFNYEERIDDSKNRKNAIKVYVQIFDLFCELSEQIIEFPATPVGSFSMVKFLISYLIINRQRIRSSVKLAAECSLALTNGEPSAAEKGLRSNVRAQSGERTPATGLAVATRPTLRRGGEGGAPRFTACESRAASGS